MRVLLIKTSSLGDLIHMMPALTDASRAVPGLVLDWVVEEGLAPICRWHPSVGDVFPIAMRNWRKQLLSPQLGRAVREMRSSRRAIRAKTYDAVIDAQGLYKSAFLARWARGPKFGFDRHSAREGLASFAYDTPLQVARDIGIIERNRQLFAKALGYGAPHGPPEFGLDIKRFDAPPLTQPYVLFIHGASWPTKSWPTERWRKVANLAQSAGLAVAIPWYTDAEREDGEAIAAGNAAANLFQVDIAAMGALVAGARGVVSVETGFAHLAAALGRPTVTLYGPTGTRRHATTGTACAQLVADLPCSPCYARSCKLCEIAHEPAPCMTGHSAETVWSALQDLSRECAEPPVEGLIARPS